MSIKILIDLKTSAVIQYGGTTISACGTVGIHAGTTMLLLRWTISRYVEMMGPIYTSKQMFSYFNRER